jgi:hypothetical protein
LPDGSRLPASAEMRPLIVAEPMLRVPRPEMVAELNGASFAWQGIAQSANETDAKTHRSPKGARARCKETFRFCENFRGARPSSHCFR